MMKVDYRFNRAQPWHLKRDHAISLVQLSAIVMALGLLAAAVIPDGKGDSQATCYLTTMERMKKIDDATKKMTASWGRRPCPASGLYYPGHADFGDEDGTRGDCADSGDTADILTPFVDTDVVTGAMPAAPQRKTYTINATIDTTII